MRVVEFMKVLSLQSVSLALILTQLLIKGVYVCNLCWLNVCLLSLPGSLSYYGFLCVQGSLLGAPFQSLLCRCKVEFNKRQAQSCYNFDV